MDPLLEQFLSEARENLAFIDQNIEEVGDDNPELLNSVFRAAHTLKGGSGIVGFESIKDITHHAEDLLDMLRSGKLEFCEGMREALYNAFDEVMSLVEAAEESGEILDADEDTVSGIITALSMQMGKEVDTQTEWQIPFSLADKKTVLNYPLLTLRNVSSQKIAFKNQDVSEEFCSNENLYAIVFDVDESCMVYGNDPIYALSLLGDKVLGVFSCMSDENAKSVLSGTEDEDGLLLKSNIVAYVYTSYEDIEESLFNFIDELELLPLDISTLLEVNQGDASHKIDSLKELKSIAKDSDLTSICDEIKRSLELVGKDTLQYFQLERFLDISGLIEDADITKLASFFDNLYKGEIYSYSDVTQEKEKLVSLEVLVEDEVIEEVAIESVIELNEITANVLTGILLQQQAALVYVENDEDLKRVISILEKTRKFIPSMPTNFDSKYAVSTFLDSEFGFLGSEIPSESQVVFEEKELESKREIVKEDTKKVVVGKTVKIEQSSVDSLMNVAGELLVAKNSLPYLADNVEGLSHDVIKREIMEKYIVINRLTEQLQDLIMGMRMLPISYVFDRYPKLVRDIAKKLGKKVKLEMNGGETKLDKTIIEMLTDPMIHIIRNSLDHGIETSEMRKQKGKESSGCITLNAYAQSDRIMIEIIDDGAGINIQRVANKVLEKGLMTHEEIDALNEDEMAELVLLPGLSTAQEITELSGRGVGMDVVKKSIESFGGSIHIKTKQNVGTSIILAVPMSLAVTSLLHIEMNSIHYGIPMDSVWETVKFERDEIEYLHNEPFVYIRGEVIPLLFIKSMLNEEEIKGKALSIVVLNIKDNFLAVVVNDFLGQLDVVQKPLDGIMQGHPLFSGTALLGNGQIIMSIDPLGLLSISQKLKEDIEVA